MLGAATHRVSIERTARLAPHNTAHAPPPALLRVVHAAIQQEGRPRSVMRKE